MSAYPPRDLSRLNTLGVPAKAEHFVAAESVAEVQTACRWARDCGVPLWVLGEGSNTLAASHVKALVIQPALRGIRTVTAADDYEVLEVGAGENWHQLVCRCLEQGLYGLENLSLIPGSVGAAPIQNIGAYGVELSQVFESLDAVNVETGEVEQFDRARCAFGYRDSVFKQALRGRYVITHVRLRLSRVAALNIGYPALAEALAGAARESLTPQDVSRAVCRVRREKLPDPRDVPNCGSFFKNPVVDPPAFARLRTRFPQVPGFPYHGDYKLAAGWLIERAGWKGREYGGIVVHSAQALVLTNPARLTATEVMAAAAAIQQDVKRLFAVELEIEPQVLGHIGSSSCCSSPEVH